MTTINHLQVHTPTNPQRYYDAVIPFMPAKLAKKWSSTKIWIRSSLSHPMFRLSIILEASGNDPMDFTALKNMKILDIACGSKGKFSVKKFKPENEPWFCRIAAVFGARVTGLDIRSNKKEAFKSKIVDLSKQGALEFIKSESFDVVNIAHFFAGELANYYMPSPFLAYKLERQGALTVYQLEYDMRQQAASIVKDGGLLFIEDNLYKKEGDRLHEFEVI